MTEEYKTECKNLILEVAGGSIDAIYKLLAFEIIYRPRSFGIYRIENYLKKHINDPKLFEYVIIHGMNACVKCGSSNTSIHGHNLSWHDGEIMCDDCGSFVRYYDAG